MLNPSSGGRDVLFRLAVATDPQAKAALAEWGKLLVKTQETATAAAIEGITKVEKAKEKSTKKTAADAQRERDKEAAAQIKQDRLVAGHYLKEHLKAIDDKVRAEKKAEEEVTRWKENLRRNSRELEFRENARLARESAKAKANAEREAMRAVNMERIAMMRRREGTSQAISGGMQLARGVAYSGMIGERNTQTVLNTLLAVEAGGSLVQGARGLHKGIGTAAAAGSPLAAMAGPALAAAAALAGVTAAAVSFVGFIRDVKNNGLGGGSAPGSFNDAVGSRMARGGSWFEGLFNSKKDLELLEQKGWLGGAQGLRLSELRVQGLQDQGEASKRLMAERAGIIEERGAFNRRVSVGNLARSRDALGSAANAFRGETARGEFGNPAALAAYDSVRASMEQMRSIQLDIARTQLEGSRAQLSNLHQSANLAKQIADETKRAYQSDALKLATATPEDLMQFQEIARKRKSGEMLTRTELEKATELSEFDGLIQSESERRVKAAGAEWIIEGSRAAAEDAAAKNTEITEQVIRTQLEVTQKTEVTLMLEGAESWEAAIMKGIDEQLPEKLRQMEERINRQMDERMKFNNGQQANIRRVTQ